MPQIDGINQNGEWCPFVDQDARDQNTALSLRITKMNTNLSEDIETEAQRAVNAETALEISKVTKETGKGLSSNNFTDEYKGMLDEPAAMTGATADTDGEQGDVPQPNAGDQGKYLDGSGAWSIPHDTTYENATSEAAGLMSATDKDKLDNIDTAQDDVSASNIVFNADGSISETLGNGKTKVTMFNEDGSITQVITNSAGTVTTLNTTFNNDGSITRTSTTVPAS